MGKIFRTLALLGIGPAYVPALAGASIIPSLLDKRIKSKEELDKIVEEEAEKLGINDKKITARLFKKRKGSVSFNKEGYQVDVGGIEATRSIVRHELYHIYDPKDSSNKNIFNYLFKREPRAIRYQIFGIK